MNVTEKQKQIMINFMRAHPDFGRGRLRYNRINKKKIDELWEELVGSLNSSSSGPRKSPKEWAKTWRDWKSNLLKRVAAYKSYAAGTCGGSPKVLNLSSSEDDLLEFLSPEASGTANIPEGGACPHENEHSTTVHSTSFHNSTMKIDTDYTDIENFAINISPNVSSPVVQKTPQEIYNNPSMVSTKKELTYSEDEAFSYSSYLKEPTFDNIQQHNEAQNGMEIEERKEECGITKKNAENIKHLFEQHTTENFNMQQQMLQLEKEKLALAKDKFEFKKKTHKETAELLTTLIEEIQEVKSLIQSFAPEYVDDN